MEFLGKEGRKQNHGRVQLVSVMFSFIKNDQKQVWQNFTVC